MAGDRLAVFTDTNALVPAALRDILIEAALDDLISVFWSPQVITELRRVLLRRPQAVAPRIDSMLAAMTSTLPSASVNPQPLDLLGTLPDPADVPILRAAIAADCSVLLTFNLKDFPASELRLDSDRLEPMHPDAFVVHMLTTHPTAMLAIIQRIRDGLTKPPLSTTPISPISQTQVCPIAPLSFAPCSPDHDLAPCP